ncbi:MAG: DUF488 domain-containing protein [Chloroflexi bacterium]|nr:DUF488 domain-containing protein [Chloroflexota bacterium]
MLRKHCIDEVMDVRSSPSSRYSPHFNYAILNAALEEAGIGYVFLGGELGGRPVDRSCYDEQGRVRYDRLANSDLFEDGIRRVVRAADERRVAVMCSEKEPLDCHRALLIAKVLEERGVTVEHILADGSVEGHDVTMNRLMDIFKLPHNGDLFRSRNEVIADALARRAKKVAYIAEGPPADSQRYAY